MLTPTDLTSVTLDVDRGSWVHIGLIETPAAAMVVGAVLASTKAFDGIDKLVPCLWLIPSDSWNLDPKSVCRAFDSWKLNSSGTYDRGPFVGRLLRKDRLWDWSFVENWYRPRIWESDAELLRMALSGLSSPDEARTLLAGMWDELPWLLGLDGVGPWLVAKALGLPTSSLEVVEALTVLQGTGRTSLFTSIGRPRKMRPLRLAAGLWKVLAARGLDASSCPEVDLFVAACVMRDSTHEPPSLERLYKRSRSLRRQTRALVPIEANQRYLIPDLGAAQEKRPEQGGSVPIPVTLQDHINLVRLRDSGQERKHRDPLLVSWLRSERAERLLRILSRGESDENFYLSGPDGLLGEHGEEGFSRWLTTRQQGFDRVWLELVPGGGIWQAQSAERQAKFARALEANPMPIVVRRAAFSENPAGISELLTPEMGTKLQLHVHIPAHDQA